MLTEKGRVKIIEQYISREETVDLHKMEMRFYNLVKLGKRNEVLAILNCREFEKNVEKPLSDNPLQSLKYHLTVTAAMLARFCIEGGLDCNRAYEISDHYIRRGDRAATHDAISKIYREMCLEYLKSMEKLRKERIFSKPIVMSIDYIYSNLHRRITAAEIAAQVQLNENYFSKLFKQETGIPVSRYILLRKIETAQNLLTYSDYSCAEISELLAFSSQSHFITRFREECGVTPHVYRNQHFNQMELSTD